ncbi:MAG: tRNA (cytidine(34)-2'-O)-methyltransferase [Cytophagales bacterium]|nr:tRNA (cytidine(34)-2'-O)-methyltransferase [Cytophagales bacterium]
MSLNIVLIEPEIPMNTGNIGRLSLASGCNLHLVKPFGFELDDKRLKRAGLDYWKHISFHTYESSDEFFEKHIDKKLVFFSSHGEKDFWDVKYQDDLFLIFGKESVGLSPEITDHHKGQLYKIPIFSSHVRSLNLANAVSVVVYEGVRQLGNSHGMT